MISRTAHPGRSSRVSVQSTYDPDTGRIHRSVLRLRVTAAKPLGFRSRYVVLHTAVLTVAGLAAAVDLIR